MKNVTNFNFMKRFCHQHIQKSFPMSTNFHYISCNDCIYFNSGICHRFIKINFDNGTKEFTSAIISRSHYELCGPEAIHKIKYINEKFLGP
jgi:hypothetical protein